MRPSRIVCMGAVMVLVCAWLVISLGDRDMAPSGSVVQVEDWSEESGGIEYANSSSGPTEVRGTSKPRRAIGDEETVGFVVGVLLNTDDEPVRGTVRATDSNGVVQTTTAWNEGRFEFTFEGATDCLLEGVSYGHGSGVLESLPVVSSTDDQRVELRVTSAGSLRGRITSSEGRALAYVAIRLESDWKPPAGLVDDAFEAARLAASLDRGGSLVVMSRTDEDGLFEAVGLARGDWHVDVRHAEGTGSQYQRLTTEPVPADGRRLELSLGSAHLRVHVGLRLDRSWQAPAYGDRARSWPATLSLDVRRVESARDGRRELHRGLQRLWPEREDGQLFIFDVAEEEEYVVSLYGGEHAVVSKTVYVPKGSAGIDVEIAPVPPSEPGVLEVTPVSVVEGASVGPLRLSLFERTTGFEVRRLTSTHWEDDGAVDGSGAVRIALPPGEYLVEIDGEDEIDFEHGWVAGVRQSTRWSRSVVLEAGQTTRLDCRLQRAAKLRFALPDGNALVDFESSDSHEGESSIDESAAIVVLVRAENGSETRLRSVAPSLYGPTHVMRFRFGFRYLAEGLDPGAYTLVARHDDGRVVERSIVLRAGVTSEVEFDFRAANPALRTSRPQRAR